MQPLPIFVKVLPWSVEWKRPVSVDAQTSPATEGWTRIAFTVVLEPKVAVLLKVEPVLLET